MRQLNFQIFITIKSNLILGCFFLFCQISLKSQNYYLDTIYNLKYLGNSNRVESKVKFNANKEDVICLYKVNGKFNIHKISLKSGKSKTLRIKNKSINSFDISSIKTFAFENDSLFFFTQFNLIGYSFLKKEVFYKKSIKNIDYSHYKNGIVYFGRYYNFHPKSNVINSCVYSLFLKSNTLDSANLDTRFMEYTHYKPAQLISFNSGSCIYPDLGGYKVYIYNSVSKTTDSVMRKIDNWVSPSESLNSTLKSLDDFNKINNYFPLIDKENFEKISKVEFVEYIDSNQFLVRWYSYDTTLKYRVRTIDIWTEVNNKFVLSSSIKETDFPIKMDSSIVKFGFPLFSENFYTHYTNDYVIQIRSELELNPKIFRTYREYLIERSKYGKENDPIISIWVFKRK